MSSFCQTTPRGLNLTGRGQLVACSSRLQAGCLALHGPAALHVPPKEPAPRAYPVGAPLVHHSSLLTCPARPVEAHLKQAQAPPQGHRSFLTDSVPHAPPGSLCPMSTAKGQMRSKLQGEQAGPIMVLLPVGSLIRLHWRPP